MGNHNSFNLNHKEQLHSARINSLNKDPTLGMLPMEKLGKVFHFFFYSHRSVVSYNVMYLDCLIICDSFNFVILIKHFIYIHISIPTHCLYFIR